jgi:hypothetical protein
MSRLGGAGAANASVLFICARSARTAGLPEQVYACTMTRLANIYVPACSMGLSELRPMACPSLHSGCCSNAGLLQPVCTAFCTVLQLQHCCQIVHRNHSTALWAMHLLLHGCFEAIAGSAPLRTSECLLACRSMWRLTTRRRCMSRHQDSCYLVIRSPNSPTQVLEGGCRRSGTHSVATSPFAWLQVTPRICLSKAQRYCSVTSH